MAGTEHYARAGYAYAVTAEQLADLDEHLPGMTLDRRLQLAQAHALLAVVEQLLGLRHDVAELGEQLRRATLQG